MSEFLGDREGKVIRSISEETVRLNTVAEA